MKINELVNAPQWLVDASTKNANVEIKNGAVVWYGGDFLDGDFRGGDFLDGNFLGGDFRGGDFLDGNFLGGNFLGGNFLGGNFWGGDFLGGDFLGGNFLGGNFLGGNFLGGYFLGGNFRGGDSAQKSKYTPLILQNGNILVGCKGKLPEEWIEWIESGEEFDTPRGTVEFAMIRAHILATIAYMEAMEEYEVKK